MTSMSMAERFLDKLAAGDLNGLVADDGVSWHNLDDIEGPLSAAAGNFATVRAAFPDFRYDEIRYTRAEDGVSLARFVIKFSIDDGAEVRAPGCLVVTERDGLITRVEEYLDGRPVAPLAEALSRRSSGSRQ